MRRWDRRAAAFLTAVFLTAAFAGSAMAAEDRTPITEISLTVDSNIESGSSGGNVHVTGGDGTYRVGGAEILNDNDDWMGGMTPRVEVWLHAGSGYYFASTSKSIFTIFGDEATVTSVKREDERTTLVVTLKLGKLENGDLTVTGACWDEGSGTAYWDENRSAKYYQVRLYRESQAVTSTRTTTDTSYDFAGDITRRGDYYFEVRAVGSGAEKGDWESSDSWFVSSYEADDLSYGYSGGGPGGSDTEYSNGGPGMTGIYAGTTGSYPGMTGGYPGYGSNSAASGGSSNIVTGGGNYWCIDDKGKWYHLANGQYPYNSWQAIDGRWYCFNEHGYLRYGWIQKDGKWYYCGSDGALLANARTPDGYYVGGDGVWIP